MNVRAFLMRITKLLLCGAIVLSGCISSRAAKGLYGRKRSQRQRSGNNSWISRRITIGDVFPNKNTTSEDKDYCRADNVNSKGKIRPDAEITHGFAQ
jgi:hypothetical protein